jgi:hypothetical protein
MTQLTEATTAIIAGFCANGSAGLLHGNDMDIERVVVQAVKIAEEIIAQCEVEK